MEFWRFADEGSLGGLAMLVPSYDYQLGWVAGIIAVFAGFTMFPSLARVRSSRTAVSRAAWLVGGALTMAIGFWGTQNLALLGFGLPAAYHYDAAWGFAALAPVFAGTLGALLVLREPAPGPRALHLAAALLGLGLAAMHYTLMEAITGDVIFAYEPGMFALSVAMPYGWALLALYASVGPARMPHWARWLAGSVLLGGTVLGSHFTAMAAVSFFDDPAISSTGIAVIPALTLPLTAGLVLFLLTAFWLGSVVDGRLAEASAAVRSGAARHRAVIETMLDPHLITDAAGLVHSCNPAAEAAFGWRAEELVGQPLERLLACAGEGPGPARATGARRRWTLPEGGLCRDGTRFPVEVAVSPFEVEGERFVSWAVRDLRDSWAAQARLRRLAAAIEHAADAVVILDADHRVTYVNPQYERQTGLPQEEILGKAPGGGASGDAVYAEIWATVGAGRTWSGQVRSTRRNGAVVEEELTVTPVVDAGGGISGYVAVMRDVTRRIEADLERRRMAEALQHCTDAIEILDAKGRIAYVNAAFERATGQRLADVRGSRPEALTDFGVDGAAYEDMMRTAIRGGQPWSGTLRSVGVSGEPREEDVTVSPIRDERGALSGYVVVKRDATVRRRLEAQGRQRQKLASLTQLAEGIAQELNAPMQQLEDNLRFLRDSFGHLDRLLAELNELARGDAPVRPAALAGCLQSADVDFLRREITEAIDQSAGGARRMDAVVRAMRDMARSGGERMDLDLNRAVQSTITVSAGDWRPVAEVHAELDPQLPPLRCVPGEIGMVMLNALLHAAQSVAAANRSGIRGKGIITVTTRRVGDWAEVRVAHNGRALSPAARQAAFDPGAPGTGAAEAELPGMALAHEVIVQKHHGTIAVESGPDRAPAIVIRLPLEAGAGAAAGIAAA